MNLTKTDLIVSAVNRVYDLIDPVTIHGNFIATDEVVDVLVTRVVEDIIFQLKEELDLGSDLILAIEYLEENML